MMSARPRFQVGRRTRILFVLSLVALVFGTVLFVWVFSSEQWLFPPLRVMRLETLGTVLFCVGFSLMVASIFSAIIDDRSVPRRP